MQNIDNRMAERLLHQCACWPCQNPIEVEISAKNRKMRSCHEHIGLVSNRFNQINGTTDRDLSVKIIGTSKEQICDKCGSQEIYQSWDGYAFCRICYEDLAADAKHLTEPEDEVKDAND